MTDRGIHPTRRGTAGALVPLCLLLAVAALGAAPADAAPAQALASAPTNWPGVELDLMSVERKGNVLTVKWAVTNGDEGRQSVRFGLTAKATTYLVDEENGTKYYALTDQDGNALASEHDYIDGNTWGVSDTLDAGATARYWAKFPAPPPEVKTLTVLFDQTEPFEEVPIADK
ncbi:MAG TPA: hypothetical protein VF150_08320 [Thermoanaerobaculia bacterium]